MKKEGVVTVFAASSGGPLFILFITLMILKLADIITISWLWVTAPLWLPLAIFLSLIALSGLFLGLIGLSALVARLTRSK